MAGSNFACRTVHNNMLMCRSMALDNMFITISPMDSDQKDALLHASFKGTTLFGGKLHRANKELASSVTVYPAASPQTYSIKPYTGRGRSFRKGGSSYRRGGRDRDQSRCTPSATTTKPSKSGNGQAIMTVTVPQDSNQRKVQSNEGAPLAKSQKKKVIRNRQNEGIPPPPH